MDHIMNLSQGFGANDGSSQAMAQAIRDWFDSYYAPTVLRLPYTIVRKLVRAVFAEYETDSAVLAKLPARMALEMALIGGESYLKPVFTGSGWQWRVIPRTGILVFERDYRGEPTDVGLAEQCVDGRHVYTLLERRKLDGSGILTVENRLFRSQSARELGREVSLTACARFAALPQRYSYPKTLGGVGLVRLKMPMANCIDGSGRLPPLQRTEMTNSAFGIWHLAFGIIPCPPQRLRSQREGWYPAARHRHPPCRRS